LFFKVLGIGNSE